jgi:GNAT superfamily N-acetyltransferase
LQKAGRVAPLIPAPRRTSEYPGPAIAGTFSQLAVLPSHRGTGFGRQLLEFAENRLVELGADDVVIDTSSLATQLIAWYERRGYRSVGNWQWDVTNYQSVVLHKQLAKEWFRKIGAE